MWPIDTSPVPDDGVLFGCRVEPLGAGGGFDGKPCASEGGREIDYFSAFTVR